MIDKLLLGTAAALVLAAGLSVGAAGAVTGVDNGDIVDIGPETVFLGDVKGRLLGGPSDWEVTFNAPGNGSTASALVTLSSAVADAFDDLTMSWLDADDRSVLATIPITPVVSTLGTLFTPDALSQILSIAWSGTTVADRRVGFDVTVTAVPVPLPAGVLLMLAAVGGLGAMRARRRAA